MESIIFEAIPPPVHYSQKKIEEWAAIVIEILKKNQIRAISLPEVFEEKREGKRTLPFAPKIDNLVFGECIRKLYPDVKLIPNKITVHLSKNSLLQWVDNVYESGIRELVFVGGESHNIQYPGLSVIESTILVKDRYPDLKVGGITIFSRYREPKRLLEKMKAGIDFFLSQIIFESTNAKQVLRHLYKICHEEDIKFPEIYLSLAPASKKKDVEFMQWLGVEFPSAIYSYLMHEEEESDLKHRTFEVIENLLEEFFFFMEQTHIPIRYNIEHVTYDNQDAADQLIHLVQGEKNI